MSKVKVNRWVYNPLQRIVIRGNGDDSMKTVAVPDDTNDQIEELQDMLPWSPDKKDIVAKAVENFHNEKQADN